MNAAGNQGTRVPAPEVFGIETYFVLAVLWTGDSTGTEASIASGPRPR